MYTFSKTLSTANGDSDVTNPFDTRKYNYGLSSSDITHNFVTSYVYDVPGIAKYLGKGKHRLTSAVLDGWQISGITTARSGTPTTLNPTISGIDTGQRLTGAYSLGSSFYLRSNPLVKGAALGGNQINTDAFYIGGPGNIGPWPNAYMRQPRITNFDLSVFKNFNLGAEEKRRLQLRLEMFNVFNNTEFSGRNQTTNLTTSAGATGSNVLRVADFSTLSITNNLRPAGSTSPLGSYFGEFSSARGPRIIQLAAKLYF
jgi:hypothetical protein